MRSRARTRMFLEPVPLVEIGVIHGHHIQALAERTAFIVDGLTAILCTPLEYQLALQLLRATPGTPLRGHHLQAALSVDRRSLGNMITTLRRKLFHPLGLEVASVPHYGYLLLDADPPQSRQEGNGLACDSRSDSAGAGPTAEVTKNQRSPD